MDETTYIRVITVAGEEKTISVEEYAKDPTRYKVIQAEPITVIPTEQRTIDKGFSDSTKGGDKI